MATGTPITNLTLIKAEIIRISLNKLIVNGPAKFKTINKNHIILKKGIVLNTPLFLTKLRVCLRSYIILAPLNIPEEVKPWAIIIQIPPTTPILLILINTTITILMWTTEEYAMATFISVIRITIKASNPLPSKESLVIYSLSKILELNIIITKNNPYPPNFSKTPAKIIEPETGASTWALGNHK